MEGYKKALNEHGIKVDESIIFTDNIRFTEEDYRNKANQLFNKKDCFTAIFAGHDRIAFVIAAVAYERGIKLPDDISIVGYDDLPFTQTHPLSLTTMHQPIYEIGRQSMKLLMSKINGVEGAVQNIVLPSSLVERHSVKVLNHNTQNTINGLC